MLPPSTDTPPEDAEFDLDVRIQPVVRHVSADVAEKPPSVGKECGTAYTCCPGTCN